MDNRKYINYLLVTGKIDKDTDINKFDNIIDSDINLRKIIEVMLRYDTLFNRALITAGKLYLISGKQADKCNEFIDSIDKIDKVFRSYTTSYSMLSDFLGHIWEAIDNHDITTANKSFELSLKVLVSPMYIWLDNKNYLMYDTINNNNVSVFIADHRHRKPDYNDIGMVVYKNGKYEIHYTKERKEKEECWRYIRDNKDDYDFVCIAYPKRDDSLKKIFKYFGGSKEYLITRWITKGCI